MAITQIIRVCRLNDTNGELKGLNEAGWKAVSVATLKDEHISYVVLLLELDESQGTDT